MPRFTFVVYTNPVAGREAEYNDWYNKQHVPDLKAIPGVISARRFKLAGQQIVDKQQQHKYLALYEIEAADPQAFFKEMMARSGTDKMVMSTSLEDGANAIMWEAL